MKMLFVGVRLCGKRWKVAVFVYKQKTVQCKDYIVGPFDQIIKTANCPVLADIMSLAYEGGISFSGSIFYQSCPYYSGKFGVPFFDVYDPRFSNFGVPLLQ